MLILFESQLIQKAKSNGEAFGLLYERYFQKIYAFIGSRVRGVKEAEDITSEVWENVLLGIQKLNSNQPEVFRGWLFQIARHKIADHYRQQEKAPDALEKAETFLSHLETPAKDMREKEGQEELRTLLKQLPDRQQEIVSLKYFSGLKNRDIAVLLDISEKTVSTHLNRALETLSVRLENHVRSSLPQTTLQTDDHPPL